MKRSMLALIALVMGIAVGIGQWQMNGLHADKERNTQSSDAMADNFSKDGNLSPNPFINKADQLAKVGSLEKEIKADPLGTAVDSSRPAETQQLAYSMPLSAAQIRSSLADLEALSRPNFEADNSPKLLKLRSNLIFALENDETALAMVTNVLDQSIISGDMAAAEQIGDLLAHVTDTSVAQLAQNWLRKSRDAWERSLALQLLKSQVIDIPDLRQAALDSILWEANDEVWLESVTHMTDLDVGREAASVIEDRIRVLMVNDNPEVRAQAVQQYATIAHRNDQQFSVAMMLQDPDQAVRLAAARAMKFSPKRTTGAKTALLNLLASSQEAEELREAALHALGGYGLSEEKLAMYRKYADFDGG